MFFFYQFKCNLHVKSNILIIFFVYSKLKGKLKKEKRIILSINARKKMKKEKKPKGEKLGNIYRYFPK